MPPAVQKQLSSRGRRALCTQASCICDHGQKCPLIGSELSSSHTISGQENLLSQHPQIPFSLPPSQPQSTSPTLTKAKQIALALPVTCPQRPAPRQSKGASLGTATTPFLLGGDQ